MLHNMRTLLNYAMVSSDGEHYKILDALFHEEAWTLRYFSVSTRSGMSGRDVKLPPKMLKEVQVKDQTMLLSVPAKIVEDSPAIGTDMSISQEAELLLAKYWQWANPHEEDPLPPILSGTLPLEAGEQGRRFGEEAATSRLRSIVEMHGYSVRARDGELGRLDSVFCDENWAVRYALVDVRKWFPGKSVLIPVACIEKVRWADASMYVEPTVDQIKEAPGYKDSKPLTEKQEAEIQRHFGTE